MASPSASSVALPPLAPKQAEKSASGEPGKAAKPAKEKDEDGIVIEELAMPRTMIQRLARSALPPSTQIQKDALLALSKSATLFINHIAGGALEDLQPNKKTIQPANVFAALEQIEFAFMIPVMKAELEKFVAIQANKKEEHKRRLKEGKSGADGSTMLVGDEDSMADGLVQTRNADPGAQLEAESAIDRQRTAKRAKGIGGGTVVAGGGQEEGEDEEEEDVEMGEADAGDVQDGEVDGETDDEATESEDGSGDDAVREDGVGTEPEEDVDDDEGDDSRTEEDSD